MTQHLIHVGFPKTGSTFLQNWFAAHPELAFRNGAIAGFHSLFEFADAAARGASVLPPVWRVTSYEGLSTPVIDPLPGTNGDRSASAVLDAQTRACEMLAALFPTAHILIVTRGYRSMVLSSYSQYVRTGGTVGLPTLFAEQSANVFDYDRTIALYSEAFEGRVTVLPFARRGLSRYRRWVFANRLNWLIALLNRMRPADPVTVASVPDFIVDRMRGSAASLASLPVYEPYTQQYLFGTAAPAVGPQ